jgi:hypothetical protein
MAKVFYENENGMKENVRVVKSEQKNTSRCYDTSRESSFHPIGHWLPFVNFCPGRKRMQPLNSGVRLS